MTAAALAFAPLSDPPHLPPMPRYEIRDLQLSPAKLEHLWRTLEGRPSEFSDFEAPDAAAFEAAMFDRDMLWYEVVDRDRPAGPDEARALLSLAMREMEPNATLSLTLLDKRGPDKVAVLKAWVQSLFHRFPIHRLSIEVPKVHFALLRLVEKTGWVYEGKRRDGVCLRGHWVGLNLYGLLRHEVDAWP